MVWKFYAGITGLNNKEVLNCIPSPYKLVKSDLTERRIQLLMECMYEAQNRELCQIVGDHFDSYIDAMFYGKFMHAIAYFLTFYKKALRQIQAGHLLSYEFK